MKRQDFINGFSACEKAENELWSTVASLNSAWNWDVGAEFRISIKKPGLQGLRP